MCSFYIHLLSISSIRKERELKKHCKSMSRGSPQGRLVVVLLIILVTFCHTVYAYIPTPISHLRIRSPIILQQRSITSTTWNHKLGRLWSTSNEDNAVDNNNVVIKREETSSMVTQSESNSGNTEIPAFVQKVIRYLQLIATIISESPIWRKYNSSLSIKPVLTKSFSSMLGFLIGDFIAQMITRKVIFIHSTYTNMNIPSFLLTYVFSSFHFVWYTTSCD